MKNKFTFLIAALMLLTTMCLPWKAVGQSDYSNTQTSNCTLTAGTNGSACTVNSYDGIKVGTSSKGGDMTVTVPSGAKYLHIHVAAWNGVSGLSLNITPNTNLSPTSVALTADSNISGSSPFTLSGDPTNSNYYKVITFTNALSEETTITFTTSTTKRFVIWGVNSEEESSGPTQLKAPTLTPTAGNGKVTLSWIPITGAKTYTVMWADNASFTGGTEVTGSTTTCEITGLTNGQTYYFKAKSIGDDENYLSSDYGDPVNATPSNLVTITFSQSSIKNFTNSYAWYDWTANGISGKVYAYKNSGVQVNSGNQADCFYNETVIPGIIKSVRMVKNSGGTDRSWTLYVAKVKITSSSSSSAVSKGSKTVTTSGETWTMSNEDDYNYILFSLSGGASKIERIEITYEPVPTYAVTYYRNYNNEDETIKV